VFEDPYLVAACRGRFLPAFIHAFIHACIHVLVDVPRLYINKPHIAEHLAQIDQS
jgi:hypothetical protein